MILADRTSGKWKLQFASGILSLNSSSESPESEPVFRDRVNVNDYWLLYINNGMLQIDAVSVIRDDSEIMQDDNTGGYWKLIVDEGVLGYETSDAPTTVSSVTLVPNVRIADIRQNCMYVVDNDGSYLITEDNEFIVTYCFPRVTVHYVNGQYQPCKQCKWLRKCIIPKRKNLPHIRTRSLRHFIDIYECEEYTPRKFDWVNA